MAAEGAEPGFCGLRPPKEETNEKKKKKEKLAASAASVDGRHSGGPTSVDQRLSSSSVGQCQHFDSETFARVVLRREALAHKRRRNLSVSAFVRRGPLQAAIVANGSETHLTTTVGQQGPCHL